MPWRVIYPPHPPPARTPVPIVNAGSGFPGLRSIIRRPCSSDRGCRRQRCVAHAREAHKCYTVVIGRGGSGRSVENNNSHWKENIKVSSVPVSSSKRILLARARTCIPDQRRLAAATGTVASARFNR